MTTRSVLLRTTKDPFRVLTAEETLAAKVLGGNNGNLLFTHAAHRHMSTPGTTITPFPVAASGRETSAKAAEQINERHDVFVMPLANAFRREYVGQLEKLTRLVEQLRIPVVVLGVGAQGPPDRIDLHTVVREPARRFVEAVLERSASIGVRGEHTRDALVRLGIPGETVDVIGCPSLFGPGREADLAWRSGALGTESPVAVNLTLTRGLAHRILHHNAARYRQMSYLPQNSVELMALMGTGEPPESDPAELPSPTDPRSRLRAGARFFVDPSTWRAHLAQHSFSFGTRLHGTIAALTAGTPAVLATFDSRTREVAEHHAIPHVPLTSLAADTDLASLYELADPAPFLRRREEALRRYVDFLDRNHLDHAFRSGTDGWDERLAATTFPPGVGPAEG